MERRPPAKLESREPKTVRFTPSEIAVLVAAARERGDDFSRYVRECVFMGHRMLQALPGGEAYRRGTA